MQLRHTIKINAKRALTGFWVKAIVVVLLLAGIRLLFWLTNALLNYFLNAPSLWSLLSRPQVITWGMFLTLWAKLGVSLVMVGCSFVVLSPLRLGVAHWYYQLGGGEPEELLGIFTAFSSKRLFLRSLWLQFQLGLRRLLWGLLFLSVPAGCLAASVVILFSNQSVVPTPLQAVNSVFFIVSLLLLVVCALFYGMWMQRYFLAQYLVLEEDLTARQAITRSIQVTQGSKGYLLAFHLSFLPWVLLSLLILPILYFAPYYDMSRALYARYLIQRHERLLRGSPNIPAPFFIPGGPFPF